MIPGRNPRSADSIPRRGFGPGSAVAARRSTRRSRGSCVPGGRLAPARGYLVGDQALTSALLPPGLAGLPDALVPCGLGPHVPDVLLGECRVHGRVHLRLLMFSGPPPAAPTKFRFAVRDPPAHRTDALSWPAADALGRRRPHGTP